MTGQYALFHKTKLLTTKYGNYTCSITRVQLAVARQSRPPLSLIRNLFILITVYLIWITVYRITDLASKPFSALQGGFWQHRICGTGIDQATYRLAAIRGRMDWLCVACSLAASNPSDQVPVAKSTRADLAQGKEILSPPFAPEIILF